VGRVVVAVLALVYPFLLYGLLTVVQPRMLAALAAALVLSRVSLDWRRYRKADLARLALPAGLVAAVLVLAATSNDRRVLLFVPALCNLALLVGFARTLGGGPSMVETLARLRRPHLPQSALLYCRRVTWIWCVFFTLNIVVSVWLVLFSTLARWTLYNGGIAYGLIGLLYGVERVYRAWRVRAYGDGRLDVAFRKRFPPPVSDGAA
jgi:uncharacterized membrane protein